MSHKVVWLGGATILLLLICTHSAWAQVSADTMGVSSLYRSFKRVAYSTAAVCLCIGAVKAYRRFLRDGTDGLQGILAWFTGALVAIVVPPITDALFR